MMHNKIINKKLLSLGDRYRIYVLLVLVFAVMTLFAPHFFNAWNLTSIMKTVAMNGTVAIGFTIILIVGQLDLSIGTIITFAAVIGLGLKEAVGYGVSVPLAIIAGGLIGLINGLLVAKVKINSFIVTLGMLTALQGAIYTITGGNTIAVTDDQAFAISDWLQHQIVPTLTPRVVIAIVLVISFSVFLRRTRTGRNFFMVGGNSKTAWLAGVDSDKYTIVAFVISGVMAAIGGILFAMESAAATLNLGTNSLMYVLSATIIGGTSMAGGKGGVFRSFIAVLTLTTLYNGIVLLGLGNEVQIFISGVILASVIFYEAFVEYRHDKIVGQRTELLKELEIVR
ncbi:MAG: hypothetical protein DRP70_04870 [Spirochaetes bacterium]|nr:MAG: hypothetical protein DRP70_04870 [Spirochaetota bacterium]RKX98212.1 MAG: hypothetical protein DRZ90_03580 [Spirochaetota bacterium]